MATTKYNDNGFGVNNTSTKGATSFGGSYGFAPTASAPSAANAQGSRLAAQAAALGGNNAGRVAGAGIGGAAGKLSGGAGGMSQEDLLAMLLGMGGGGGGGGGGGRGAAIASMLADVDKREQAARDRYAKNAADTTTMYGQLASKISDYRPTIESDYDTQVASTNDRAAQQQGALTSELAAQDQRRANAASALGITGEQLAAGPELQSQVVLNEALGDIGNTAANWSGFLNAERGTALQRNQNNADAANATGAATNDDLRMALENYLQGLDSERAQIRASGSSGGGGGGGRSSGGNALQTYLGKALIDQMFATPEESEFSKNLKALQAFGVTPASLGNAQYQKSLGAKGTFDNSSAQALGLFSLLGL